MKAITTTKLQVNSIIEHIHQKIRNMVQSFEQNESTEKHPWDSVLAATLFVVQ